MNTEAVLKNLQNDHCHLMPQYRNALTSASRAAISVIISALTVTLLQQVMDCFSSMLQLLIYGNQSEGPIIRKENQNLALGLCSSLCDICNRHTQQVNSLFYDHLCGVFRLQNSPKQNIDEQCLYSAEEICVCLALIGHTIQFQCILVEFAVRFTRRSAQNHIKVSSISLSLARTASGACMQVVAYLVC